MDTYFDSAGVSRVTANGSRSIRADRHLHPHARGIGPHWITAVAHRAPLRRRSRSPFGQPGHRGASTRAIRGGNLRERHKVRQRVDSAPAAQGAIAYAGSADGRLYAFNAKGCGSSSFATLWTDHRHPGVGEVGNAPWPALSGGDGAVGVSRRWENSAWRSWGTTCQSCLRA